MLRQDHNEGDEEGDPVRRHPYGWKKKLTNQVKTKGHQIAAIVLDQDYTENSLPSSLMEEEEEE